MTQTWWLENGHWTAYGDASGRYWVNGDGFFIEWDESTHPPPRTGSPATRTGT